MSSQSYGMETIELLEEENAVIRAAKTSLTDPRCRRLLALWYEKSKTNIITAVNTKCGYFLKKDPLTQKIVQSLRSIRIQWMSEFPGEDNKRQQQYEEGPGYHFEQWMDNYNLYVNANESGFAFWMSSFFDRLACTATTKKFLDILEEKGKQLLEDLDSKHKEIFIQIEAANTYDHEINILKTYGVIDVNGKLAPDTIKFKDEDFKLEKND